MRQRIIHGTEIEFCTPAEVGDIINSLGNAAPYSRIRASAGVLLDATGSGTVEVYKVPIGMDFSVRRVDVNLLSAADPSTGSVPLGVPGVYVKYKRSGQLISYAIPLAPTAIAQVPGVETWGFEEGPCLRNGEVFEVDVKGLTAAVMFDVKIEGLLWQPRSEP